MIIALIYPNILSPIIMASSSLLYGVGQVAESRLMQKEFSDHQRATMSSLNSLGGSIGFALMSVALGKIADTWGPAKGMVVMVVISLPMIYFYWLILKNHSEGSVE